MDKHCPSCGETDIKKFGKNKLMWDGLAYYCKACDAIRSKKRYANATEEQMKAHVQRCYTWRRNNPIKAREIARASRQRARERKIGGKS